ncbi:MAG: type II secretion system major pseudopilin GspG, partial [Pseudomonadota bacterium]
KIETSGKKDPIPTGYTFAELLAVLLILGLVAAIVTPQILGQMERAKVRAARIQAQSLLTSVELMAADIGRIPTAEEGLDSLVQSPSNAMGWQGPYLRNANRLMDPWGRKFTLTIPGPSGAQFAISSLGADGKIGGERGNADINEE